ncbi:TetR family transcriptional regulator [Streptomyces sp. NPDC048288]|uniref:TetR family transcriptional regulator n=1 Tax=Streptomyces sp. NPDC048288 TaxID=3365529 RepID=UPI0037183FAA
MEIARAAAGLFVRRGLRATRAEDIAQAAGIAPRTFYRYFATKEEAVAPLYAAGARRWAEAVRSAPAALSVPEALEHAVHHTLTPGEGVSAASWEWVRTLMHLADTSPALRRVWAEVCRSSEDLLTSILAERTATPADNAAPQPQPQPQPHPHPHPQPHPQPHPHPHLRFTSAVASAAVRVAVESWAAGTSPATGAQGPAALALRNLGALRGFAWGAGEAAGA